MTPRIFKQEELVQILLLILNVGCGGLLVLDILIIIDCVKGGVTFMPHSEVAKKKKKLDAKKISLSW